MFYISFIQISIHFNTLHESICCYVLSLIYTYFVSLIYTYFVTPLCTHHSIKLLMSSFFFFFTYVQYLNTFACMISSLFSCSRNFYVLYYDLFYIQRFCYLSCISGMWCKLELQMHRREPRSILYTTMVILEVCETLLSRCKGREGTTIDCTEVVISKLNGGESLLLRSDLSPRKMSWYSKNRSLVGPLPVRPGFWSLWIYTFS